MSEDDILSKPVGTYRDSVLLIDRDVYAARRHTLSSMVPEHLRRPTQVLIISFGQLTWINLGPSDVLTLR